MKNNMHSIDRILRILFAIVVPVLYFTNTISGAGAVISGVVALVFAVTAAVNFCPIYYVLGISTIKHAKQ